MITKAIVQSINATGTRCRVRIPLFETASSSTPIEADALVNITPGIFNNLAVNDVVFISFEENEINRPIILGKLFRGADAESNVRGGTIVDTLKVHSNATLPAATIFSYPTAIQQNYAELNTPKKTADYIKWLEALVKSLIAQQEDNFKCLKNWTQWQLQAENIEIDDGDLDENPEPIEPYLYQKEGAECKLCIECSKKNKRSYSELSVDKKYPEI